MTEPFLQDAQRGSHLVCTSGEGPHHPSREPDSSILSCLFEDEVEVG